MTGNGDAVARTEDGRYFVVGGRRWRASDPSIPETFRQALVDELMAARRLVKTDPAAARPRVRDAKIALGERGAPWWEPPTPAQRAQRLAATIRALARRRAPDRTICPSDAARAIGGEHWRELMVTAREVARTLARAGEIEILQKGRRIDPAGAWKGPIRLRIAK